MLTVASFVLRARGPHLATTPFFPFFALSVLWMPVHPVQHNTNNNSVMCLLLCSARLNGTPPIVAHVAHLKIQRIEILGFFFFFFFSVGFKLRGFGFINGAQDVGGVS